MSTLPEKTSAAERREARRKRILENLDSRLNKIASFEASNGDLEVPEVPKTTLSRQIEVSPHQHIASDVDSDNSYLEQPRFPELPENWSPLSTTSSDNNVQNHSNLGPFFLNRQLHIILLSLLIHALLHTSFSGICYKNALVPFMTLELAELFTGRISNQGGLMSLVVAALAIFGISNRLLKHIPEVMQLAATISADFCLYLFVLILSSKLFV